MSLKPLINLSNTKRRTKWYYVPWDVIQKEYSIYNVHLSKKKNQTESNQISNNYGIKRSRLNNVKRKPLPKSRNLGDNLQEIHPSFSNNSTAH